MHTSQNERGTAKERFRRSYGKHDARDLDDVPGMPAIERYLAGLNYPASTQNLVDAARRNGAPDYVLELIDELPERDFRNHAELSQAMELLDW